MAVGIKFCGLNDEASVRTAGELGAEYAGFIFYPASPRAVSPQEASELSRLLPARTQKVAVTVDLSDAALDAILGVFNADYIQLHGHESAERVGQIRERTGKKIIKALAIRERDDLNQVTDYLKVADLILFDAKPPKGSTLPGGNGVSFDWHLLQDLHLYDPWFLSGGLTERNVAEAIQITHAPMVDVSSSVETKPGQKNPKQMKRFADQVR